MPSYRIVYFNSRGRAEPARMMLSLANVDFVDDRFTGEEWPKRKEDKKVFPTGQAPVMVVDGQTIPQSKAMCNFLARELGFYGQSNMESAKIDVVIETMGDVEMKMIPIFGIKEEEKKVEAFNTFKETSTVPFFNFLVELIKANGGKHFVGNKLTLADLHVFNMLDIMTYSKYAVDGLLDKYPELRAFYDYVKNESELKSYLEKRPQTDS